MDDLCDCPPRDPWILPMHPCCRRCDICGRNVRIAGHRAHSAICAERFICSLIAIRESYPVGL